MSTPPSRSIAGKPSEYPNPGEVLDAHTAAAQHPHNPPNAHWAALERDYSLIRQHIAAVIPGFEDFEKSIADISGTPTSKSVVIRLEHR